METRNPARHDTRLPQKQSSAHSKFEFRISRFVFVILFALNGCGSPGDPQPPRPPVPVAVTDLAARQVGDSVVLTFTLPQQSTEGDQLASPPDVEIFRAFVPAGGQATRVSLAQVYTIPYAVVDTYLTEERMRFADPLKASEIAAHAGEQMAYMVRARASKRAASADSNRVLVRVYPVPEAIRDVLAHVKVLEPPFC